MSPNNYHQAVLHMLVKNNSLLQKIIDYQLNGVPSPEDDESFAEENQKMKDWILSCQRTVWVDLISQFGDPQIDLPPGLKSE